MSQTLGDFDASTVVYGKFSTFRPSTGATFTLGGTPALSVYKDNSTTQSTTGVTLTVDFDSVTGLNHFAIDTSADGTFYAAGSFFDVVITTGTVDSVSVTGSVVASFTIRKSSALKPATAGRTLVVDAAGLADSNVVKVGPTGSGTAQTAGDIIGDTNDIQTRLPDALSGGNMKCDVLAISTDTTAADNLELQFDGTGVVGDFFPATQSQLASVSVTGAALNVSASAYTLTTGTQSLNTYVVTGPLDGVHHEHTDTAGAMELYYQFNVTAAGSPTSAAMTGRLNSANDVLGVYAYNWAGASWDQIGTLDGQASSTDGTFNYTLFVSHVGTGADDGLVRIRFYAASGLSSATLRIDQIFVSYAIVPLDAAAVRAAVGLASANVDTQFAAIQSDTDDLQTRVPAALIGGRMDVTLTAIGNDTTALTAFKRAVLGNVVCTVGAASTTTSIVTSASTPSCAAADQLKGRILTFDKDTTTAALRGQATDITASSNAAAPVITCTALTTAPVSGDTFTVT